MPAPIKVKIRQVILDLIERSRVLARTSVQESSFRIGI